MPLALLFLFTQSDSDPKRSFVAGPKEAYFMAQPEVVSGGRVTDLVWAGDGTLIAVRELVPNELNPDVPPPDVKKQLVAWFGPGKPPRMIFDIPAGVSLYSFSAMGSSDRLLVTGRRKVTGPSGAIEQFDFQSLLSARTGALRSLIEYPASERIPSWADVSRLSNHGYLVKMSGRSRVLSVFDPSGRTICEIGLTLQQRAHFDRKGDVYVSTYTGDGKVIARPLNTRTGQLGPPRQTPDKDLADGYDGPLKVLQDVTTRAVALIVPSDKKREGIGIVTSDGNSASLSPKFNAVAYVHQGVALVRSISSIDRKNYDRAFRAVTISKLVSQAKEVGVGLHIYAADHDDLLPGQGDDLNAVVGPYLRNTNSLSGFTYTFSGGSTSGVTNLSGTELGHIPGPGGRAVVYVDGSVRWLPDQP